jgi:hypothetical protein
MLNDILQNKKMQDSSLQMLKNKKIFISKTGMTVEEIENQKLLINVLGGLYFNHFHEGLINMVVMKKPSSLLAESIMNVYNQIQLVNIEYFKDCLLYKKELPAVEYSFHNLDLLIKNSYLLDKRSSLFNDQSAVKFGIENNSRPNESRFSSHQKSFKIKNDGFNYPSGSMRNSGGLGTNLTNQFSNLSRSGTVNIMKDENQIDERMINNSMSIQFKSMKDQSQKSLADVPFKSFLFEKCLFYFYSKDVSTLKYKKLILEHSGSIVKKYQSLTKKQLMGRDFFFICNDGFDYSEVFFHS